MTDFYLKFADEAEANTVLNGLEGYSIDVIGTVYKNDVAIPGWHVNLRGAETDAFLPYETFPKSPDRIFA